MKKVRLLAMAMLIVCMLASNVFAANFTPSVESQDAPVVTVEKPIEVNGQEVKIEVTPVSKADAEDTNEEVSEKLAAAKQDIVQAPSLGDLPSQNGTIGDAIDQQLKGTGYTADDLVVRDLFDVSLTDADGNIVEPEGPVDLTFAVAVAPDETLLVLHRSADGNWEVIDSEKVQVNYDGTVTVTFDSLSPIAFVTVEKKAPDQPSDKPSDKPADKPAASGDKPVTSPQTGETTNVYMVIALMMLLASTAFCGIRAKRTVR